MLLLCQRLFLISSHNANVKTFALMTAKWNKERNKLNATKLEIVSQCKSNYDANCTKININNQVNKNVLKKN